MKIIKRSIDIEELVTEYKPDNSIFTEDTERFNKLSNIIFNHLEEWERRVILLYAECKSIRKVAKILDVSPSLVNVVVNKIRNKVKLYY